MEGWRFDGFPGRVLLVNLSEGTVEPAPSRTRGASKAWAEGLATRVLVEWDTTEPRPTTSSIRSRAARRGPSPFHALLVFTGPSKARRSARPAVPWSSRSPLTDVYIDTYVGGNLGHRLRGRLGRPVPHRASDTLVASKSTTSKRGSSPAPNSRARPRGPANRPSMASGNASPSVPAVKPASALLTDHRRPACCRGGGTGAQFGFKRLKAITVNASPEARQLARIHDPDALAAAVRFSVRRWASRSCGRPLHAFGTSRDRCMRQRTTACRRRTTPPRTASSPDGRRRGRRRQAHPPRRPCPA